MRKTDKHLFFYGGPAIYSNWYPAKFVDTVTNLEFANSEQAWMWYKAHFFGDIVTRDLIAKQTNPGEVKKLGRQIRGFNGQTWDLVGSAFMVYVNYLKYSQNAEMAKELLDTGTLTLVEASPYDTIWGVGLGVHDPLIDDPANWRGQNRLGVALGKVRDLLWQDIKGQKEPGHL